MKKIIIILLTMLMLLSLTSCNDIIQTESFEIDENGDLIVTYSNGTSKNLGKVKGEDGKNGENGKDGVDGVGIARMQINENSEIIITFSDREQINYGKLTKDIIWEETNDKVYSNVEKIAIRTTPDEETDPSYTVPQDSELQRTYVNYKWSEIIKGEEKYYVLNSEITTEEPAEPLEDAGFDKYNNWGYIGTLG